MFILRSLKSQLSKFGCTIFEHTWSPVVWVVYSPTHVPHTHTHTHTRTHMHICTHTQFIGLPFRVAIGKETLQKDEHVKRNTTCSVRHSNVQGVISASETSLGVHSGRYKPWTKSVVRKLESVQLVRYPGYQECGCHAFYSYNTHFPQCSNAHSYM